MGWLSSVQGRVAVGSSEIQLVTVLYRELEIGELPEPYGSDSVAAH